MQPESMPGVSSKPPAVPVLRRDQDDARADRSRKPQLRLGAVVAIALLAGFGAWLVLRSSGSSTPTTVTRAKPVSVSTSGLTTFATAVGQPIYWVGRKAGFTYELTSTPNNDVYIRYLPAGAKVGTKVAYLTIGTYPLVNAYAATNKLARAAGAVRVPTTHSGVAFYNSKAPTSVYVAYPGAKYQIEVYDPNAAQARQIAASGQLVQVATAPGSKAPVAASPAVLSHLAATLQHSVYWTGTQPRTTYELTTSSDGRAWVRYLPKGVAVGSAKPYLTIGTYPLKNAFAVTSALLKRTGEVSAKVGHGGVAVYAQSKPTNIYVAFPKSNVQIEVYDPNAARARQLVASNQVTPVG